MIWTQTTPTPGPAKWIFQSLLVEVQSDAALNITGYRARVVWKSDAGTQAVDEGSGPTTEAAIKALNTGNFSAGTSLEQVLMSRALANGVLPAGAASGDPI